MSSRSSDASNRREFRDHAELLAALRNVEPGDRLVYVGSGPLKVKAEAAA